MTTRREASNRVYNAIVKCLLAYDAADAQGKSALSRSLTGLYAEYVKINESKSLLDQPYSALTDELKNAKSSIKKVSDDRDRLKNALVSAQELLDAATAVLALLP